MQFMSHVQVNGSNLSFEGSKINTLTLTTEALSLDSKTGAVNIPTDFNSKIDDIGITGRGLQYNFKNYTGYSSGGATFSYLGSTMVSKEISYNGKSREVELKGAVQGDFQGRKLQASVLDIGLDSKSVSGSSIILSRDDGTQVISPYMFTNFKTHITHFIAPSGSGAVAVTRGGYLLKSDKLDYNDKDQDMEIDSPFTLVNTSKGIVANGSYLYYNEATGIGKIFDGNIATPKGTLSGDEFDIDSKKEEVKILGTVHGTESNWNLEADSMVINGASKSIEVTSPFTLTNQTNGSTLKSTHMIYSDASKDLLIDQPFEYQDGKYTVNADTLKYNILSGNGVVSGNVKYNSPKTRESGSTNDPVTITGRRDVAIPGNVTLINGMATILTKNITYNLQTGLGVLHESGVITDITKRNTITFQNGDINGNTYVTGLNTAYGTIPGTSGGDTTHFATDRFLYYLKEDKGVTTVPLTFDTGNIHGVIDNGTLDLLHSKINGKNPTITSTLGDKISAKYLSGDLNQLQYMFTGNVTGVILPATVSTLTSSKGQTTDTNQPIEFSASQAQMFLQKIITPTGSTQYITRRMELQDNCVASYSSAIQKSDFMEIDNIKHLIFAKFNAIFDASKKNLVAGKEDLIMLNATADSMISDLNSQIVELMGDVTIKNKTNTTGSTTITSDSATLYLKSNAIVMSGSATLTKKESKIQADKATLDMTTNKLIGNKNIYMELSIPKN